MANKFYEAKEKFAKWIDKLGKARLLIATVTDTNVSFEIRHEALTKEEAMAVLSHCPNQYLVMYNEEPITTYFKI